MQGATFVKCITIMMAELAVTSGLGILSRLDGYWMGLGLGENVRLCVNL
jgi:hypothetical protein